MRRATAWAQESFIPLSVILVIIVAATAWLDSHAEAIASEPKLIHVTRRAPSKLNSDATETGMSDGGDDVDVDRDAEKNPAIMAARKAAARGDAKGAIAGLRKALAAKGDSVVLLNELAAFELRAGRSAAALTALDHALKVDSKYYRAHYNRGLALARSGDDAGALAAYEQTSKLRPNHFSAMQARGLLRLRTGKFEEARRAFAKAVKLGGGTRKSRAYGGLGLALARLKQPQKAAAAYRKSIQFQPDAISPRYNLALLLLSVKGRQERAEARKLIEQIKRLQADFAPAWFLEGRLASAAGDDVAALAAYKAAAAKDPRFWKARNNAGIVSLRLGHIEQATSIFEQLAAEQPKRAEFQFQLGRVAYKKRDLPAALSRYDAALKLAGGDYVQASMNRGLTLRAMKRLDAALAAFDAVLAKHPENASAHLNRGVTLLKSKDFDGARAALAKASSLRKDYVSAHFNLGKLEEAARRPKVARKAYEAALTIDPKHRGSLINLAGLQTDERDFAAAESTYRRTIRFHPTYSRAQLNLGVLLGKDGRHADAVKAFQKVLELDPEHTSARRQLGKAQAKAGEVERGLATLRDAIVRSPADVETRRAYALVLGKKGDIKGAEAELRRCLKLDPDAIKAAQSLASLLLKAKRSADVLPVLEPMIARGKVSALLRTRLGRAYLAQDRPKDARPQFEKAYKARPSSVEVVSALAKLEAASENYGRAVSLVEAALKLKPKSKLLKKRLRKYSAKLAR